VFDRNISRYPSGVQFTMLPEQYDCFPSYRDADKAQAELIRDRLKAAGFKVWWDKVHLKAGMRWHEEIEQHCENSRVAIPLLTPDWKDSTRTRYETYGAERIIPIVLRGGWQEIATPPLTQHQRDFLDLETATEIDWQRLTDRIRHYVSERRPVRVAILPDCFVLVSSSRKLPPISSFLLLIVVFISL
jgi:hypothetical protein